VLSIFFLQASFYSTQLGETRNSVAELRANTIWKSSELSPEMERTYRMVAYDHELVPPPQANRV
jgi:hypothetical protein